MEGDVTQPQCPHLAVCEAPNCPVLNVLPFYYDESLGCRLDRNGAIQLRRARAAYEKDFATAAGTDEI